MRISSYFFGILLLALFKVFLGEHLIIEFDLTQPNQLDSWMNVVLLLLVMILMITFSLILSQSVSNIVLKPLEQLLTQVWRDEKWIIKDIV